MQVRVETTTPRDLRAKQGAVVSKFLTFFQRKNTLVIELYAKCFYNQKPQWDRIADFVSESLCYRPELRNKIKNDSLYMHFRVIRKDKHFCILYDKIYTSFQYVWLTANIF